MVRIGFVQWPDCLRPGDRDWTAIAQGINDAGLDILITNELPFGEWIASRSSFDRAIAQRSIDEHAEGLAALTTLSVPAIVTSRPAWAGERLANEAVLLQDGEVRAWRRKRYFPAEPGWYETSWYEAGPDDFPVADLHGLGTGVLLCTEAMFNERARRYGRAGARLIAIPRATGPAPIWRAAGQMAAIVSGAYVVSSNRLGGSDEQRFGGGGFAYAPDGTLLTATGPDERLAVFELDSGNADRQQHAYPCYVAEPDMADERRA
ncbi:MAG: carbon-nitrogen hydrolase family protein [Sphingomonas sp.]